MKDLKRRPPSEAHSITHLGRAISSVVAPLCCTLALLLTSACQGLLEGETTEEFRPDAASPSPGEDGGGTSELDMNPGTKPVPPVPAVDMSMDMSRLDSGVDAATDQPDAGPQPDMEPPPTLTSVCGDAVCQGGESCDSCPRDCGYCTPNCGDGVCRPGEYCTTCASDCGKCEGAEPDIAWADAPIKHTVYVDASHPNADDKGQGRPDRPFAKMHEGVRYARDTYKRKGESVRVLVHPGVYRERVDVDANDSEATMVIEAAKPGTVTISGSDVWTGWQRQNDGTFEHEWPYDWGFAKDPSSTKAAIKRPLGLRREMIFVNGARLEPKEALAQVKTTRGTFVVDEQKNLLTVNPPAGVSLNSALVEVAVRRDGLLSRSEHVVIRGFVIEHVANHYKPGGPTESALKFSGGPQLAEQLEVRQNNLWGGSLSNVLLRRSSFHHNGHSGIVGYFVDNVFVEDVDLHHNNWRIGTLGGLYTWDPGNKFGHMDRATFRRLYTYDNESAGLWFDYDNTRLVIEDSIFHNNLGRNLFIEANEEGPITIRRNVLSSVRYLPINTIKDDPDQNVVSAGLLVNASVNVHIHDNVFYNNDPYQIAVVNFSRCLVASGFSCSDNKGKFVGHNMTLDHNVFYSDLPYTRVARFEGNTISTLPRARVLRFRGDREEFFKTFLARDNVYFQTQELIGWEVHNRETWDLGGWKTYTTQEKGSIWADPSIDKLMCADRQAPQHSKAAAITTTLGELSFLKKLRTECATKGQP